MSSRWQQSDTRNTKCVPETVAGNPRITRAANIRMIIMPNSFKTHFYISFLLPSGLLLQPTVDLVGLSKCGDCVLQMGNILGRSYIKYSLAIIYFKKSDDY